MEAATIKQWPWWRVAMLGLSVLGLALSAYLSWHALSGAPVIGCGGTQGCEQVLSSRWSSIGGKLPISGLAAGTYLAMLVATFFAGPKIATADRRLAWGAMLLLMGAAVGSAIWFTSLQIWEIGALCRFCLATHITSLLLAALVIWQAPRQVAVDAAAALGAPALRVIRIFPALGLFAVGLLLAGGLAATQLAIKPPPVFQGGETEEIKVPTIDPKAVPLVGSPDAPYVVTLLFDYKCPHCQKLHAMLDDVIKRYEGKIAFALCPAPLNTHCNPYVARDIDQFKDSCELARMGMAVWAADHKAFAAFDTWMFTPEPEHLWHAKTLEAARAKAVELLGQAKFEAAEKDPWVDRHMQASIRIYGDTIHFDDGSAVPKLVLGRRWVTPEPDDAEDLAIILHQSLHIPLADATQPATGPASRNAP